MENTMKRIGVISFFQSQNLGDILIGESLNRLFGKYSKVTNIDFSSTQIVNDDKEIASKSMPSRNNNLRNLLSKCEYFMEAASFINLIINSSKKYRLIEKEIDECDTIILAGGNMLMDTGHFPIYTYKAYYALKYAKAHNKKTAVLFVGAGPINNKWQKSYIKKLLMLSDFTSTRDALSADFLKSISPNAEIDTWIDPVLIMDNEKKETKIKHRIGISVFYSPDKRNADKIKNAYVDLINYILDKYRDSEILLYSSAVSDINDVCAVYAFFDNTERVSMAQVKSTKQLVELYRELDLTIASRMHSMIVSFVNRKPVIALGWQSKVDGLMEMMEFEQLSVKLSDLNRNIDKVADMVGEIYSNYDVLTEHIDNRTELYKQQINDKLCEYLEGV